MQSSNELRLAVLIDGDNTPRRRLKEVMEEIAVYGTPTIKRIYGDWTSQNMAGWKKSLLDNAITPVQQYSYTTGKNATDSAMIIDAMDILYTGKVEGFCLVSSDSDFTRLATRLREAGMKVFGFGEKKTPNPFIVACDKFIYVEIIGANKKKTEEEEEYISPKPSKKAVTPPAPTDTHVAGEVIELIADSIDNLADDDGWAYLGEVGSLLTKKKPDFDPRNYGYKKLTLLVGAIDSFELDYRQSSQANNGKLIYIRNRKAGEQT